jgi:hypothetical protein
MSLSWNFMKWDGTVWTGFIWLRVESSGRCSVNTVTYLRVPWRVGYFLTWLPSASHEEPCFMEMMYLVSFIEWTIGPPTLWSTFNSAFNRFSMRIFLTRLMIRIRQSDRTVVASGWHVDAGPKTGLGRWAVNGKTLGRYLYLFCYTLHRVHHKLHVSCVRRVVHWDVS